MKSDSVYNDFSRKATSIRNAYRRDLSRVKKELYELTEYYLRDRLFIFPRKSLTIDPQYGIPIPYLVYWFADAFHYKNHSITNQLALTLMYAATFYCIKDDLIDGFVRTSNNINREHAHIALSNFFLSRYLRIFKDLFSEKSIFWYYLSSSFEEWWDHEVWSFSSPLLGDGNSGKYFLSKNFLLQSSKYMVGLTFPSIAAVAIKAKHQSEFQSIKNFLTYYYLGNRIVDDLRDWQEDLKVENYNRSSILNYAATFFPDHKRITEREIRAIFLNNAFTTSVYQTILKYYSKARACIQVYHSPYLIQFMNDQIEYFKTKRDYYARIQKNFNSSALNLLSASIK